MSFFCSVTFLSLAMDYRVVSDNSLQENILQIFYNIKLRPGIVSNVSEAQTYGYLFVRLFEILNAELFKHPELSAYEHKYARVIFSYPKFNEKCRTTTDWMKAEPSQNMPVLVLRLMHQLNQRLFRDFAEELLKVSSADYQAYVQEKGFSNALESALAQGEIRIYLTSTVEKKRFPCIYRPRPVKKIKRNRKMRLH